MYGLMEACSATSRHVSVVITDRPNPLGDTVDGPLVNMSCCSSGYGRLPIPFLHGMTIGELGLLFNSYIKLPFVQVIKMENWDRRSLWLHSSSVIAFGVNSDVHFPPWVPPSPNIPTVASAQAYGATVFLEATTASEGRGTNTPFEVFGAPFIDAEVYRSLAAPFFVCHVF